MYELITFSQLNDFIFCPISIYFHMRYGETDKMLYHTEKQIEGSNLHSSIDSESYLSNKKDMLVGTSVFCQKYGLLGKIDVFDLKTGTLTERKRKVTNVYDGQVFQLYGQYYALKELGYDVRKLEIYSMTDNKKHNVLLPEENPEMLKIFESIIKDIHSFDITSFAQQNAKKCSNCVYEPACDRSAL